jgi:hypothetical protein
MAHLANSIFAHDYCNAHANRDFLSAVNQLASAVGSVRDETGVFRGKPSPPGDRPAGKQIKKRSEEKTPDKTTALA